MAKTQSFIEELGRVWQLPDYVVVCCFDDAANLAFALGDGSLYIVPGDGQPPVTIAAHTGACLSLCAAPGQGFLSGGDDGRFLAISVDGSIEQLGHYPGRWIEHVHSHSNGLVACSAGKQLHLIKPDRSSLTLEHPSSIGGLSFSPDGRQLAVAHYGGVSVHWTLVSDAKAKILKWAGSHLAVTWSPDARFVLTSMQENCLRGWRLKEPQDLHMSGYSTRVKSWSWLHGGRWLATNAGDCVACWPFKKRSGPMGEAPITLAFRENGLVSAVAGDPKLPLVGVGYEDGLVLIAELDESATTERAVMIKPPGNGAVTSMAFAPDGSRLVIGTAEGFVGIMPMA
ncbi:WD40 repeat domain-containing protein [Pseudomonas sp. FFUP_PS_473]|uniref:WD40 repeat domain-containing protein n=1 Tax=Pseudomonas TaxID=286 RepID=UPI00081137C1|nr:MULTISPECIES: WD40 repeat domain-containing protein [Pseudomonas]PLP93155.1 WD40 repeat domain-containing protein [Pseudomonas sp. FFUP_PS_473]